MQINTRETSAWGMCRARARARVFQDLRSRADSISVTRSLAISTIEDNSVR